MTQSRYDPIPDLAALIDSTYELLKQGGDLRCLKEMAVGPYARLRGGLLLDFADEGTVLSTEDAIREALRDFGWEEHR